MRVTEFNVGQWCMSEDQCIAAGVNFAAYERGVSDAAQAFARNPQVTYPILTDEEWQDVADISDMTIPGRLIAIIEDRIRMKFALGTPGVPAPDGSKQG